MVEGSGELTGVSFISAFIRALSPFIGFYLHDLSTSHKAPLPNTVTSNIRFSTYGFGEDINIYTIADNDLA